MSEGKKNILVLARRDHAEAMRVAAGLTIFGHKVRLVFMGRPVEETAENAAQADLLELSDIAPETTVAAQPDLPYLDTALLGQALHQADRVISL